MAQIFLAKFNINSKIYEVYENPKLENEILTDVLDSIDNERILTDTYNQAGTEMVCRYKFCDIQKDVDNRTIVGRLVKIYDGESQSYNKTDDTVETIWVEDKAASSTFCFDIKTEEIAFITRQGLGHKQFIKYFRMLVEESFIEDAFELFLETNVGELKQKIRRLKNIFSLEATVVPPNANTDEYNILFGTTKEDIKESGATKYTQKIEIPNKGNNSLNIKVNLVDRMFFAVAKGFGIMSAKGKDEYNNRITITSNEDAPYTVPIPDAEKESLIAFRERALIAITQLHSDKAKLTVESIRDIKEEEYNE